jgi:hypothetical protein
MNSARVRMYRQGQGDCFLLKFPGQVKICSGTNNADDSPVGCLHSLTYQPARSARFS